MKKDSYYINTFSGEKNGKYSKVSGYVETVTDNKGFNTLIIGYDYRNKAWWCATELSTGLCVSLKTSKTKKECIEDVHNNIDNIVKIYKKRMADEKYYQEHIKPFEDFVNANGGFNNA